MSSSKKVQKPSKNENLKAQIQKLEKECKEYLDGWQRERADFANYKKQQAQQLQDVHNRTQREVIFQLLSVVDNIDLIVQHTPEEVASTEWYKGVEFVHKQIQTTFQDMGLQEIDCTGAFDPAFHEAVEGEGSVIESVVQKGYSLHNSILRPAKVKVKQT